MGDVMPWEHLWLPGVGAMACLIFASAFFSSSETALFYLSHDELRSLRAGRRRESMAAALLGNPDRLLTAILFWNLVINLSYFACSVVVTQRLAAAGYGGAAGGFGAGSLVLIILLGEVLPKSVAVVFRRPLAVLFSWPLAAAVRVLDPVTPLLGKVSRVVRRAFWPGIERETILDADDLERAVEASEVSDEVVRQEREVLHNILDLSEIRVEEVMRPRGTYVMLSPPVQLEDLQGKIPEGDYVAVCSPGSEEIETVIPLADFSVVPDENLQAVAEEVVHVPWCANLAATLQLLRDRFASVAVVVNEYGETVGIVTYEDVIDTIFVPEPSRARRLLKRDPVVALGEGIWQVEGMTSLRFLCRYLGLEYEPTADGQVTVAGLLYDLLEHLPQVGDECLWRGYRIRVTEVQSRWQLRVQLWAETGPGGEAAGSGAGAGGSGSQREEGG